MEVSHMYYFRHVEGGKRVCITPQHFQCGEFES